MPSATSGDAFRNNGAHIYRIGSRPAYKIRNICLARHIILRDVIGNSRKIEDINKTRSQHINEFICEIVRQSNNAFENISKKNKFTKKIRIVETTPDLTADPHEINNIPNSFEQQNETHTIYFGKLIVDGFIWDFRLRIDCHQEYSTFTFLLDNCDSFSSTVDNNSLALPSETYKCLYDDIWNKLDEICKTSRNNFEYLLEQLTNNEYKEIIEFRGYSRHISSISNTSGESIPFPKINSPRPRYVNGISSGLIDFLKRYADLHYAIIGGRSRDVGPPWEDRNAVLCGMLDGQAIYGSDLGRKSDAAEQIAVRYFVIYDGASAEQLGRLIRLLHVLGELRHAALFDSNGLRRAGINLREMGQLWGDGIRYAEHQSSDMSRRNFENIHFQEKFRKSKFYKKYGNEFYLNYRDEINQIRFQHLAELCNGDLSFRIGRSSFYAETFNKRIEDLRCVRIEGIQSYNDFMRRNIEYYFDRTTSILRRFQSAQSAMKYINERRI